MSDLSVPPAHSQCQNCGTALQGSYCHRCGQHDLDLSRSFRHMLLEALENFLHFDAKFFRNIVTLLFRPGRLSADFNAGKRAAQMPPFRLYLFTSILFFFISLLAAGDATKAIDLGEPGSGRRQASVEEIKAATAERLKQLPDRPEARQLGESLEKAVEAKAAVPADQPAVLKELVSAQHDATRGFLDGFKAAKDAAEKKPAAGRNAGGAFEQWLEEKGRYATSHQGELAEIFLHSLPKTLLFCLPFFALYTRVLFRKSGQNYLQHLVVALHFHTFVYLWWLVGSGWTDFLSLHWRSGGAWMNRLTVIWLLLYPLLMLRHLFGNSWKLTVFKTGLLAFVYGLTLAVGVGLTAAVAFFLV